MAIPSSSQAESTPFNDFGSDFSNFSSGFLQLDGLFMSPVWSAGAKQRKCRLQNCQEGAGVLWCDSNIGARVDGNSLRNKREL